jgi:septal ring-binding cell division protein DamX
VANPKPIVTTPLAPRDTTRGIEDERRRGGYGQPAHAQPSAQARFVEGRDLAVASAASAAKTGAAKVSAARSAPEAEHLDIESRLAATRAWLSATANTTHTIEVAAATSDDQLRGHLRVLAAVLDPHRIYLFRSTVRGRQTTKVIYGAYVDRTAAMEALTALPATVAMHHPTIRTVRGIKAEITRKAAS